MQLKRFTNWYVLLVLLLTGFISACQKDTGEQAVENHKIALAADSALKATSPDNYLATSGTLSIKLKDSTYTFNAANDSVAFVNLSSGDNRYFGLTAINKAHNISFGISSKGIAADSLTKPVAGGQLLMMPDAMHTHQYTLMQYAKPGDSGTIRLSSYMRNDTLAKGTFFTFLSKDDDSESPFYRVDGTFELHFKAQK
ncbi:hypothetical protein D0C36_22095 [Mucilaginibacter conchicola]|uniref:Uncharacterized protein n=1 Tax=Mucilaginibacter conchicola TaxID=2303333 RepID=A0A372NNM9_9SPHI|nr:hypothetical protein [Mucilaginibacter conchicola]RFZ90478.1 hypothetical protein D0C36_22095 [Mucilaginibacter conchicola]